MTQWQNHPRMHFSECISTGKQSMTAYPTEIPSMTATLLLCEYASDIKGGCWWTLFYPLNTSYKVVICGGRHLAQWLRLCSGHLHPTTERLGVSAASFLHAQFQIPLGRKQAAVQGLRSMPHTREMWIEFLALRFRLVHALLLEVQQMESPALSAFQINKKWMSFKKKIMWILHEIVTNCIPT